MNALGLGRWAHVVVEAVDQNATAAIDERVEACDEAPRRVREMRRGARVCVAGHRTHAQLDIEDALTAEEQLRPAAGVDRAALLQRAVAVGEGRVEREDAREVRAAALLLSFYKEAHAEGQLAVDRAVGLDGLDPQEQVSLVVIDASREHGAVAHRGVIGRGSPEVEGYSRLHVVVLHADERAFAGAGLADDEGRRALDPELVRLRTGRRQTLAAPAGGGIERARIGRLRWDRTELAQLGHESVAVLLEIPVEHVGHEREYAWSAGTDAGRGPHRDPSSRAFANGALLEDGDDAVEQRGDRVQRCVAVEQM